MTSTFLRQEDRGVICPFCSQEIDPSCIRIAEDIARCQSCEVVLSATELLSAQRSHDPQEAPPGAWFRRERGQLTVGAWQSYQLLGIVLLIFSVIAVPVLFGLTHVPTPFFLLCAAATACGGSFGLAMLFLRLGSLEVVLTLQGGYVLRKFWKFSWSTRFRWEEIDKISEVQIERRSYQHSHPNGGHYSQHRETYLVLEGPHRRIRFGELLSVDHRAYLLEVLAPLLLQRKRMPEQLYEYLEGKDLPEEKADKPAAGPRWDQSFSRGGEEELARSDTF